MAATACAESTMPWQPNLETARQIAAQSNRLVLVHFWAPWCKACLQLDQEAFSKPETGKALEANFVMVKVNVDEMPATARLYGVSSLPTDAIIAPNGRLVSQIQSPPSAAQYIAQMNRAAEGYRELSRGAGPAVATARATDATSGAATAVGVNAAAASPPVTAVATNANMPVGAAPTASPATVNTAPVNTAPADTAAVSTAAAPQSAPSDDRYADYFRQNAAAQAAAAQTPPTQNVTPQGAAAAYGNVATAASTPYGNSPAYGNGAAPNAPAAQQQSPYAPQAQAGMNPPPASQAARPAAPPQPPLPQLPPGCPTIGLEGYCPVTLVEGKQWALGDKTWGVVHRGRTYLFLGPAEKEKFLANPDRYSPVLSGNDPVLALDNQMAVAGRREFGVFGADGRIYLFADEASLQTLQPEPEALRRRSHPGHAVSSASPLCPSGFSQCQRLARRPSATAHSAAGVVGVHPRM